MSADADEYWLCDHVKPSDLEEICLGYEVIGHLLQRKPMHRVAGSENRYSLSKDGADFTWWIPENFMQPEPRQGQTAAPPLAPHADDLGNPEKVIDTGYSESFSENRQ